MRIILTTEQNIKDPCKAQIGGEVEDYTLDYIQGITMTSRQPNDPFWDDRFVLSGMNTDAEIADITYDDSNNLYVLSNNMHVINGMAVQNIAVLNNGVWKGIGKGFPDFDDFFTSKAKIVFSGKNIYCVHIPKVFDIYTDAEKQLKLYIAYWNGYCWDEFDREGTTVKFRYNSATTQMTLINGTMYLTGDFYNPTDEKIVGRFARWTGSNWQIISVNLPFNNVDEMESTSDGKIYIRSRYDHGFAIWNGTVWNTYKANGEIHDLQVKDGRVYLCGSFTTINGISANHVAEFDGTTFSEYAGGIDGNSFDNPWKLYKTNNQLWIAGDVKAGILPENYEVAYSDGKNWNLLAELSGKINSIAVNKDEVLYFGGIFSAITHANGTAEADNIISYKSGGEAEGWQRLLYKVNNRTVSKTIHAMEYYQTNIYVAGEFQHAAGYTSPCIAYWDRQNWNGIKYDLPSKIKTIKNFQIVNDTFYICAFDKDLVGYLFFRYQNDWVEIPIPNEIVDNKNTFLNGFYLHGDKQYIIVRKDSSSYFKYKICDLKNIAINPIIDFGYQPVTRLYITNQNNLLLKAGDNYKYVKGKLTKMTGNISDFAVQNNLYYTLEANTITEFNESTGSSKEVCKLQNFYGSTSRLIINDSNMLVTGNFTATATNGDIINNIALWNGTEWLALGSGISGGTVNDAIILDNEVYVGGDFQIAGGKKSNYFAYYNPLVIQHSDNGKIVNNNIEFCESNNNQLSVPDLYLQYEWIKIDGNIDLPQEASRNSILIKESGKYKVKVTHKTGGYSFSNTVNVIIHPSIAVTISTTDSKTAYCKGENLELKATEGFNKYKWIRYADTVATNITNSYTDKVGGDYYVQVTDKFGCQWKTTTPKTFEVNPVPDKPFINTTNNSRNICEGTELILSAPSVQGSYLWKRNGEIISQGSVSNFQAKETGVYTVQLISDKKCSSLVSDTVSLSVIPYPLVSSIKTNQIENKFCYGSLFPLSVSDGYTYRWEGSDVDGFTKPSVEVTQEGHYKVTVSNKGCEKLLETTAYYFQPVLVTPEIRAIEGDNGFIFLLKKDDPSYTKYQWYESADGKGFKTSPLYSNTNSAPTTRIYETTLPQHAYYLQITDQNGCKVVSDTIVINTKKSATIQPNPNQGEFSVIWTGNIHQTPESVTIRDITGRMIKPERIEISDTKINIKINEQLKGLYIIEIMDKQGEKTVRKVMVE
jgi:hypothetical protein